MHVSVWAHAEAYIFCIWVGILWGEWRGNKREVLEQSSTVATLSSAYWNTKWFFSWWPSVGLCINSHSSRNVEVGVLIDCVFISMNYNRGMEIAVPCKKYHPGSCLQMCCGCHSGGAHEKGQSEEKHKLHQNTESVHRKMDSIDCVHSLFSGYRLCALKLVFRLFFPPSVLCLCWTCIVLIKTVFDIFVVKYFMLVWSVFFFLFFFFPFFQFKIKSEWYFKI